MSMQETILTEEQAREVRELIEAMREAINSVPSYVKVQADRARQENRQETPDVA